MRHRHFGSPAVEDRIVVSATLQHPVDDAVADVVRIVSKLGLAGDGEARRAIYDGLAWLDRNWSAFANPGTPMNTVVPPRRVICNACISSA